MIGEALNFLKDHLAARLETDNSVPEKVVFVGRDKDSILFTKNAVSVLLVGIEEEKKLRAPDR